MNSDTIYKEALNNGFSIGHAQFIIGNHYLKGKDVAADPDKAEEWFTKAWDNQFPGTASTQTFLLRRWWTAFKIAKMTDRPRLQNLLDDAMVSASEREAHIIIVTHNDAQAKWFDEHVDSLKESFDKYTRGRFRTIYFQIKD